MLRQITTVTLLLISTSCHGKRTEFQPLIETAAQQHGAWKPWSENGRKAHEHLLKKKELGEIDLYFIGDSITRRWGAKDYSEFLAFWNETFRGWNAANFGWGGDSTHHMLWRLKHGELEGLEPKVISILAGTNNIGNGEKPERGDDAAEGVAALIATCQRYAPDAEIIITAIFPRNDSDKSNALINHANDKISKLADGEKIHFLNINEHLADETGKLYHDMTVDKLHLSLQGYKIWAAHLTPILERILGPKDNEDNAPPPTGDPKKFPVYP